MLLKHIIQKVTEITTGRNRLMAGRAPTLFPTLFKRQAPEYTEERP